MGRKPTPEPEWYVYVVDVNGKTIKNYNVFHSANFLDGCKKAFKKYKLSQAEELEKEIRSWAMYSFWSKFEYEVSISELFSSAPRLDFKTKKISVYDQLMLNWNSFLEYTIKHRAYFLRRN